MPGYSQDMLTGVQQTVGFMEGVLTPLATLVLAIAVLVLVVDSVRNAYELVMHIRRGDVALRAIALGSEALLAIVLLALIRSNSTPMELLYLGAAAAVAIAVRLGVAKLER